jgi:uncharacterized membrane protein
MEIFRYLCHQDPGRSFFISGKKMPVCARCTGFYLGVLSGVMIPLAYQPLSIIPNVHLFALAVIMMIPMAIDGTAQLIKIHQSNNWLRLTTGFICGVGLGLVISRIFTVSF